jgi:microsomal dipeptidase-like Zn-dependent dipeptidase
MQIPIRLRFLLALGLAQIAAYATVYAPACGMDPAATPIVDLHAHLFFFEGTGTALLGNFNSPSLSVSPSSRIGPKVNAQALESSGARIVVVALYAHPLFLLSYRESIRRQIDAVDAFVAQHSDWAVARSAQEAVQLIESGKRILILSIEGAGGILENEDDLKEFIDRRGVRIVTPVHFTDDSIGGASLMPGIEILTNPWAAFKSMISPHIDRFGARTNAYGLGKQGAWLVGALLKRGVWIDLAHTSDGTYQALVPWLERARQPFLYTHTMLREHYRSERAITPERLEKVRETGGLIGILPSDDMLSGTTADPIYCPTACQGSCERGIPIFLTQYAEALSSIKDPSELMIGSDINAPLNFLGPACPASAKQGDSGLGNYGQLLELWKAARAADLVPRDPAAWSQRFLTAWSRVQPLN